MLMRRERRKGQFEAGAATCHLELADGTGRERSDLRLRIEVIEDDLGSSEGRMGTTVGLNGRREPADGAPAASCPTEESGLGDVVLRCDGLHLCSCQRSVRDADRSRVACKWAAGEYIDLIQVDVILDFAIHADYLAQQKTHRTRSRGG